MPENPYEPPKEMERPLDKRRAWRWVGTLLIVLAIIPYVPMTVAPLLTLVGFLERPTYMSSLQLVAAGTFNGCVCAALFLGGRWLRSYGANS